eukprot:6735762-Pyramimonas_sp.AAC.1
MRALASGLSVEPPYGATDRVRGVPTWARWAHASAGIWAFGGALYGATKCQHGRGVRMRTL